MSTRLHSAAALAEIAEDGKSKGVLIEANGTRHIAHIQRRFQNAIAFGMHRALPADYLTVSVPVRGIRLPGDVLISGEISSPPYAYWYVGVTHMDMPLEQEWKKGSAELLILSLLEDQPRHGYDIGKLIESRSRGKLRFYVASLYPLLYRLENRGWIQGRWVEKPNQRRRRYYRLTAQGQKTLAQQRHSWKEFVGAVSRITGVEHA